MARFSLNTLWTNLIQLSPIYIVTQENYKNYIVFVKIYRNGVYEGQQATTGTANWTNGLKIGNYTYGNSYNWNGQIAVVKVYDRALTQGEVSQNYNHYKTRFNLS